MDNVNEKRKNNVLIWLVVVLIILVLGLAGYIAYDKILSNDKVIPNNKENLEKENSKEEDKEKNNVEEYLNYIPYSGPYSEKKVTIQEIDDEMLLEMAIYNTKHVSSDSVANDFEFCDGKTAEEMDVIYKASDVQNKVYEMYNKKVELKNSLSIPNGEVCYANGYYGTYEGWGGEGYPTKISKVVNFEYMDKELIVLEQAAFIEWTESGERFVVKKINYNDNYDNDNILNTDDYVEDEDEDVDAFENYVKNNILNKSYIYKHTFRKSNNGNYYWYSTELTNN